MSDNRPIGVFDSGIGGLTVLRAVWEQLPHESTVYFGDNGRAPYGTKSHETIVKYSVEDLAFLEKQNVKAVVIACFTASAHAYKAVCEKAHVPVVEMVHPGAKAAVSATRNNKIGIIATKATVNSGVYESAVSEYALKMDKGPAEVFSVACPLFVSLAEEGWWDRPATRLIAEEYLRPLIEAGVDTLVLGCTHYPLLSGVISEIMGPSVTLINAGKSVAEELSALLKENDSFCDSSSSSEPSYQFFTSDNPEDFENVASPFLGGGRPKGTKHVDEN